MNYEKELKALKDVLDNYFVDKVLGNAFTDFDRGHQACAREFSKDMLELVEMALKGKLSKEVSEE